MLGLLKSFNTELSCDATILSRLSTWGHGQAQFQVRSNPALVRSGCQKTCKSTHPPSLGHRNPMEARFLSQKRETRGIIGLSQSNAGGSVVPFPLFIHLFAQLFCLQIQLQSRQILLFWPQKSVASCHGQSKDEWAELTYEPGITVAFCR